MFNNLMRLCIYLLGILGANAYAEVPSKCLAPNGIAYSYYSFMSKCVEGRIYDLAQEICKNQIQGNNPYYPQSQKCVDGHIYPKETEFCDAKDGRSNPYFASSFQCCDGELIGKTALCTSTKANTVQVAQQSASSHLAKPAATFETNNVNSNKTTGCPHITPKTISSKLSLGDYYYHFFNPITKYSGAIFKGDPSITLPKNIYDILAKQKKAIDSIQKRPADFIEFTQMMNGSYSNNPESLSKVNSTVARNGLAGSKDNSIFELLNNGTACVEPSPTNSKQYHLNLYGVAQEDCVSMIQYGSSATAKFILVNAKPIITAKESCIKDAKKSWRDKLQFWGHPLGQNQMTFVYVLQ